MKRKVLDYLDIIFGSLVCSAGIALFVTPAKIASGGVSGIATMLFHLFGWNPGYVIFGLSLPLFLIGMKIFGRKYGLKALIGTVLLSAFTSVLIEVFGKEGILDFSQNINVLLGAVFGGVFMGMGTGFVMRGGANTGGTDILAQIVNKYTPLSLGTALTITDAVIIFVSAFVFGIERALYAIITVYITGITIDKVVFFGTNKAKVVLLITSKTEEVASYIMKNLDHSATLLDGKGMYSGTDKPVLMVVVANNELGGLTAKIRELDEKAFMIVQNANQVLGEGFTPIAKARLNLGG
jgi:uncharacterized membrane-anchored protein YitT (DUF2179 family)